MHRTAGRRIGDEGLVVMELLPVEIQIEILSKAPGLASASRYWFRLYNSSVVRQRCLRILSGGGGDGDGEGRFLKLWPFLSRYIDESRCLNSVLHDLVSPEPLWSVLLQFLCNRKVFFTYNNHGSGGSNGVSIQSDEELSFQDYGVLRFDKAWAFLFKRGVSLPKGEYNLQLAFTPYRDTRGLATMKLEVENRLSNYMPLNITEMIPMGTMCVYNAGRFIIEEEQGDRITLELEETGPLLKEHWELHYVDFKPCSFAAHPLLTTWDSNEGCHLWEKRVHVAIDILLDGDGDLTRIDANLQHEAEETLEKYLTTGERHVKMMTIKEQRAFVDGGSSPFRRWKTPFNEVN